MVSFFFMGKDELLGGYYDLGNCNGCHLIASEMNTKITTLGTGH